MAARFAVIRIAMRPLRYSRVFPAISDMEVSPMSDNQRRLVCRLIFTLMCALPTAISGYWICHPQTASGWEQAIKAELGVETEIEFIDTPNPFETVFYKLRFTDPEYGTLFEALEARVRFGDVVDVNLTLGTNRINNRGLARLIRTVNQNTVRHDGVKKNWMITFGKPGDQIRIDRSTAGLFFDANSDQLDMNRMLEIEKNAFVIENLKLAIGPNIKGTGAAATFSIPVDSNAPNLATAPRAIEVLFERDSAAKTNTTWLKTHNQALPCWLIDGCAAEITDSLGNEATFAGRLDVRTSTSTFGPSDQEVYLHGLLEQIDVSSYPVASLSGSPNSMQASVTLEHCEFVNGEPKQWSATLDVPDVCHRVPVPKESLQRESKQIAIGNAINTSINNGYRARVASEGKLQR